MIVSFKTELRTFPRKSSSSGTEQKYIFSREPANLMTDAKMLKVSQQSNGNDYQRRPTRFSSSFEPSQTSSKSSHQDLAQNKSKIPPTTRIPLAPKRIIRPPVDRSPTSNLNNGGCVPTEPAGRRSIESRAQAPRARPSSLALSDGREISSSTSRLATGSRVGASVLQRIGGRTTRMTTTITSNSSNSSSSSNNNNNNNNNNRKSEELSDNKLKTGLTDEDDRGGKSPACLFSSRQAQRRQNATCKQVNSSLQSSESRLGRLKNGLVAVVHPQHSQRVNSNSLATRVNKHAIMKSTVTTVAPTKPTIKSKIEKGKVGSSFYHKRDAHNNDESAGNGGGGSTRPDRRTRGEESEESKQDGGQIVARHSGMRAAALTSAACTTLNPTNNQCTATTIYATTTAAVAARQMTSSPPHYSSCCSSSSSTSPSSSCPTSEGEDKSGQFALRNNNNNNHSNNNDNNNNNPAKYLLSVASNNGDLHEDKSNDQHGNNKQSNKHLSARTYPPARATSPLDQQSTCCRLGISPSANDNHNCYNKNRSCNNKNKYDGAKPTRLTKTQASTSISFKLNSTKASKAINNDHLLPKPMGQQVLSLMMLDVGLLPANGSSGLNNITCNSINNHELQQQQTSSPKPRRSHVRVQSPTRDDINAFSSASIGGNVDSRLFENNARSFINHHERDPAERLNNHSINCLDHGLSNDFHSLQQPLPQMTTAAAHEMMRLQVQLSYQDNENLRSISLPSSPRIGFSSAHDSINNKPHNDKSSIGRGLSFFKPNLDLIRHTTQNLSQQDIHHPKRAANQTSCTDMQLRGRQASNFSEQPISIRDNQDSNSLASSSCSSLNYFPPLLALSNQLDVLKFEELVSKINFETTVEHNKQQQLQQKERYLCERNTISPNSNCQNSASTINTKASTSLSFDQVAQIAKQHDEQKQPLRDVSSYSDIEKKLLSNKKINHATDCSQQFQDLKISNVHRVYSEKELAIGNTACNNGQHHYHNHDQDTSSQVQPKHLAHRDGSCSEQQLRRQQQRSHSISGQEFHSNGGYHRLKQSPYIGQQQQQQQQQGVFDGYQNYGAQSTTSGRLQQVPSPYQQHHLLGRSPSPLSINCPTHYGSPFRESKQYPLDPNSSSSGGGSSRSPRNQLHASLECLNTTYPDYHQAQRLQEQQQQQLLNHHHQQQLHNQHYATSYVLASPPVNTIINSNGDQDLAAAAMGTPPSQCHTVNISGPQHLNIGSSYRHQTQHENLISRAMAQVSQSPLRRLGLNNPQGASPGLLSQMSSHHHPMRAGHSSLSLTSSSFIIEDKLQNEIRKLQSELKSEKEKNEALNSQLNINSSLMAAFEQSLTTLNTRLRQLTTLNEKKDNEIEDLKEQLRSSKMLDSLNRDNVSSPRDEIQQTDDDNEDWAANSEIDNNSERSMMMKTIEDLKRQLIEKDRLLTDTRLEALSAAHQLEQLESKMDGEHSILINEDELDEGVMVVNHSPSDSDAITDSAHFSEINSQISKSNQQCNGDTASFNNKSNNTSNNKGNNLMGSSTEHNITDDHHSNHSSDYHAEVKDSEQQTQQALPNSFSQQFNGTDSGVMCKLMDNLLLTH